MHLESPDVFFRELAQMFQLCQQRGAGTVYITVKEVKEGKGAVPGDSVGYLARAKISNKKARKISASVSIARLALFPLGLTCRIVTNGRLPIHPKQNKSMFAVRLRLVCLFVGAS